MLKWLYQILKRSYENPATPLWSPNAYSYLVGPRSTAGVAVNRMTVLGNPVVWRCLNLISNKIARLPLKTYKVSKDNSRQEDKEHPAWRLLMGSPSDLYSNYTWKQTMMQTCLWAGNSYAHIFRNPVSNAPEELLILDSDRTFPVMHDGQLVYCTKIGSNREVRILPENMIHFKGLSPDAIVGYHVLDVLRTALGIPLAAQEYASRYYRNACVPGPTILSMPGYLSDPEKIKRFRDEFSQMHQGLDNSHRTVLLESGMTLLPNQQDLEKSQFLQTRKFEAALTACCIFGISPHLVGVEGPADSYNSIESEEKGFLAHTLDPWCVMIEQELARKLLTSTQITRSSYVIEFDRRSLESTDQKSLSEALASDTNNGLRTTNESRSLLNLPPDPTPEADKLRMPVNIMYIDGPLPQPQINETPGEDTEPLDAESGGEPLTGRAVADLYEELAAVLPEQREAVLARWGYIGKKI